MPVEESRVVDVLWTGGWDSTFRVLELVLLHKATVQPHYIVNVERRSTRQELRAMRDIKTHLGDVDSEAAARLKSPRLVPLESIAQNSAITRQYEELRSRFELSPQYEWINRYIAQEGLSALEVGFQKNDDSPHFERLRELAVESTAADGSSTWTLPPDHGENTLVMFETMSYPLLWKTKEEMGAIAKQNGFFELLSMSWFCHFPVGDAPCGACSTCRHTVDAGQAYRFTPLGRIRNRLWMVVHPLRLLLSQPDEFLLRFKERRQWKNAQSSQRAAA